MRRFNSFLFLIMSIMSIMVIALGFACTDSTNQKADAPAGGPSEQQPSQPVADPLPEGAALLAAHVEASGGVSQIAKFESLHMEGELAVASHNLKGFTKLWWQKDGKFYLEQFIEGIGMSQVGYDGETLWLQDPITGLRKLDGAEAAGYLQSSTMFLGHDWDALFAAANTIGKQKLEDGKEVWEVELVSKDGPNLTIGLDVDGKLIRYVKSKQISLMGETPFEVRSDHYEVIEGYKFPTRKTIAVSGLLELDETITKTEVNVPIDPTMFAFPSKRELVPVDPAKQPSIGGPATPKKTPSEPDDEISK